MIFFYTIELEINDTTDTARYASYLDLHVEINDTTDTARYASYLDLHVEIKDTTDTARYASYLNIQMIPQIQLGMLHTLIYMLK